MGNDSDPPQCAECGFTAYGLEVMDFGPYKGQLLCDECWNDAPIPVDVVGPAVGEDTGNDSWKLHDDGSFSYHGPIAGVTDTAAIYFAGPAS